MFGAILSVVGLLQRGSLIVLVITVATVASAQAAGLESEHEFDIAPQSMATALTQFSQRTQLQIVTSAEHVQNLHSPGLHGRRSAAAALRELLRGSGLDFQVIGTDTVVIAATGDEAPLRELQTVVVTGRGWTRASNSMMVQQMQNQASGVAPQAFLNTLPGIDTQMTDPFGLYEFGSSVRMRGFTSDQLAVTLDGVPLEETPDTRDSTPPNRYVDSENLQEVVVAQGSGDVNAPSFHALGGSLRYFTSEPLESWRATLSGSAGSDQLRRIYARLDTPPLWAGGPVGFLSGSRTGAMQWQNAYASMRTEHAQLKLRQALGSGAAVTFFCLYGNRDDHDVSSYRIDGSPSVAFTRHLSGDPETDALYYDNWLNGRTDVLYSLRGEFVLAPRLKLNLQPYYERKRGYGYAGVTPSAAQDLYDAAIDPLTGTPGRTDVAPPTAGRITKRDEDMGGDRRGVTAGLVWSAGPHELQIGGWYQDYDFFQMRPLYNVDENGDFDRAAAPVAIYYDRDIRTRVRQFYVKDKLSVGERLTLEAGSKGLIVDRRAAGMLNSADFNRQTRSSRAKRDQDYFQPQFGFVYLLSDTEELFSNYAENFSATPRLAFVASSFDQQLKPETSTNVDLGLRSRRQNLSGSLTFYYIDYRDRVLELTSADPFRVGQDLYENVGSIRTYGAELAAYWNPAAGFNLSGVLSLNNSRFRNDYQVYESAGADPRTVAVGDEHVPATPRAMLGLNASYRWSHFFAGADAKFTGERSSTTTGVEEVGGYGLVNLNAGFKGRGARLGGLTLRANLYNLFDKNYFGVIFPSETRGEFNYGAPRTFYLTLIAEF